MKQIRAAAFFCTVLFAIGVFAQYPAQPNSGQMGTSQPPQTTQPQMTPPSQGTPSAQPSQPGQQPSQGPRSNIDDQVQILSDQLKLNADQQSKIRTILVDQHQQAMNLVQDSSMPREDKLEKIHSLREATISKVRQLLTDDQKTKFDQMIEQQNDRLRQRQEQGSTPPSGATPPSGTPPPGNPPASNPPTTAKPPQ